MRYAYARIALSLLLLTTIVTGSHSSRLASSNERSNPNEKLESGRITVALVESDIRDALRLVAAQGGVNLVMSKSVEGTLSLDLTDVSLLESLDAITTVGGYLYELERGIVTVSTLEERLEQKKLLGELNPPPLVTPPTPEILEVLVLELRHVDAERLKPVVEQLLTEEGSVSLLETSDHVTQSYSQNPGQNSTGSISTTGNVVSNSSAGGGGNGVQLTSNLASSTQGRPAKSHTLVVMDYPSNLARIEKVVNGIDVVPPSVVIETRFVEIGLDDENRMGVDWNVVAGFTGASTPHTFPFGDSSLGTFGPNPGGPAFPVAPGSVTLPGQEGLYTFGALDLSSFGAVLEMIERDSRIEVVSNPRIVVNDRHTATILVGERYPILSANVSEFGTVTEQLDRYEPIGVQLVVTPSVLSDDEVELFVRPTSSSIGALVESSSGLQVARINSRQIDTAVTVRDGQTVVLGGLITTREAQVRNSVPVLGSIPILGSLFSHERKTMERVDLVVFLTVRIVKEAGLTDAQRQLFEDTDVGGDLVPAPASGASGPRSELEFGVSTPVF